METKIVTTCPHLDNKVEARSHYLYCSDCGAVKKRFDPLDRWHICELCVLAIAPR